MQNIPGIALEKANDQLQAVKVAPAKKGDQHAMFADLFNEHAAMVENELSLSPVSSQEKMLDSAPQTETEEQPVNAAGTKAPEVEEPEPKHHDEDTRMTQEDLDEVKDDLEEYGMSKEEIAEIEEKVNSEEGMTWGEFTTVIAEKVAEMHSAQLSASQKSDLNSFFAKFGFTEKESAKLISRLENGDYAGVMKELQAKVNGMPKDKQILLEKSEIEAFSAALSFSKEFTAKLKELLGGNTLPKELKEAFTLIRQEFVAMDKKDRELVRAVGKAFAHAMGDTAKHSSAARQLREAVDLKPRVAEEHAMAEHKEELNQGMNARKDAMPDASVRQNAEKSMADKVEIKSDAKTDSADEKQQDDDSDNQWNNFFDKMSDDSARRDGSQLQGKGNAVDTSLKTGLANATAEADKAKAWAKVAAPKVMKQVETAVLRSLESGVKQLTLQLTPENLGKLNIVLQVQGKEVSAVIRAENADSAKLIADNIDAIKNSLENQGLKVDKLDVQSGLANNQDRNDWFGQEQHNLSREREAMIAMRNHMRSMREGRGDTLAQDMQSIREQAINAAHGLHVIA